MKRSIEVHLGEIAQRVGTLHYNQDGNRERSAFEYHGDWLADSKSFPIEPALRLVSGPQFYKASKDGSKFSGAIADTEPDGWGRRVILRDHAKRREQIRADGGRELPPPNALDFLLAVDDMSRMGALRLRDGNQWQRADPESGRRTTPPVIELPMLFAATRAVENQTETEADLAYLRGRGTSLGGLRPKCSPPYHPKVVLRRELVCTPVTPQAASTADVEVREDICQIPGLDQNADYDVTVPFRGVPRFGSVTSDFDKLQFITSFQNSDSHPAVAKTYIVADERSRYSGQAIRNRYEVKIGETLDQSCTSAVVENHSFHEKARGLDRSCISDNDCVEHSRFNRELACFDETLAYKLELRDDALDRSGLKATTYCELRSPGLGSSYCEAGDSLPREHHTRCIQKQCTVIFETHVLTGKKIE